MLDPATRAWEVRATPGAPPASPNGTFGRRRYVPAVDAFVLLLGVARNVRFYEPR